MGCSYTKPVVYELPADCPEVIEPEPPPLLSYQQTALSQQSEGLLLLPPLQSVHYSPNDRFSPPPSIPPVERSPCYDLNCVMEGGEFADNSFFNVRNFFREGDRSKFGVGNLTLMINNYCGTRTRLASAITDVCDRHLRRGGRDLEVIIINNRLDEDDEKLLENKLVEIAISLESLGIHRDEFLTLNFVQIQRSKRLSGNFVTGSHSKMGCLEDLRGIWIARAEEPVKSRLNKMVRVYTACDENKNLGEVLQRLMGLVEKRHSIFAWAENNIAPFSN